MPKDPNNLKKLILIHGDEEFLVDQAARKRVDALVPLAEQPTSLEIFDGCCSNATEVTDLLARVVQAVYTGDLFGGQKAVWLRDANFFNPAKDPGRSAAVKEAILEFGSRFKDREAPNTMLISGASVDKRTGFYKTCKSLGEEISHSKPKNSREAETVARGQISAACKRNNLAMDAQRSDQLLLRAGTDARLLMSEVAKLAVYANGAPITEDDIRLMIAPNREAVIWDFMDAFGSRRLAPAISQLRRLFQEKQTAVGIVFQLTTLVRNIIVLRECMDRGWLHRSGRGWSWGSDPQIDSFLTPLQPDPRKMHPFRLGNIAGQAHHWPIRDLKRVRKDLVDTHYRLVSSAGNPELLLELCIIRCLAVKSS